MARIRNIKPSFFLNEDIAYLPPLTRLLFIGLWTLADRDGRLEDRPRRIKVELLPYDQCDVDAMLDELEQAQFIERYDANGRRCISIPSFTAHQAPHHKEPPGTLPPPPKGGAQAPANGRGMHGSSMNHPSVMHGSSMDDASTVDEPSTTGEPGMLDPMIPSGREGKGREGRGSMDGSCMDESSPTQSVVEAPARPPSEAERKEATDVATPHGLLHALGVAVRDAQGMFAYDPGSFAAKEAREFCEAISPVAREDARAHIAACIADFAADAKHRPKGWSMRAFRDAFNGLAAARSPSSKQRRNIVDAGNWPKARNLP